MATTNPMDALLGAVVALATSVLTGATAGAHLVRTPLVVRVDDQRRR